MHDEEMDKNKLTFKHLKLQLLEMEKPDNAGNAGYKVTVADLASLMESLQSCLLKYWEYEPASDKDSKDGGIMEEVKSSVDNASNGKLSDLEATSGQSRNKDDLDAAQARQIDATTSRPADDTTNPSFSSEDGDAKDKPSKPFKKRPIVFLLDEAHKLPALVDDQLSLKVFLDTLLVLTKQDRLCHVILSTSDSFFHHFLRGMNVGHHSQLITIGDCTKEESREYFDGTIQRMIPAHLQHKLTFDELYGAFGGKLAHINDYVSSWSNCDGDLTIYESAIFIQAYTLLQFHLTRSTFATYSPLSVATSGTSTDSDDATFTPEHLIHVMKKLVQSPYSLPYFQLCREIGTDEVDSMIKTRILELRWTKSVAPEDTAAEHIWSQDGIMRPVVLPMTRIVRRAMEVVLKELPEIDSKKAKTDGKKSEKFEKHEKHERYGKRD